MKYPGKERKLSWKNSKRKEELLGLQDWDDFIEDRMFGGEIFDEVNKIENDIFFKHDDRHMGHI